ncbi:MAG TPA: class I SAM-dependent methyltransferase [Kofleriaceae bacterium]|nr:class I SAM-dependent methyltransferase [Kofleriaceae bacterium]
MDADLAHRRGKYGIDAPYVPLVFAASGAALVAFAGWRAGAGPWSIAALIGGLWCLFNAASFLYTTRAGKFAVWAGILRELGLRGDERVLDMGCGRGAVLLLVARLLPRGRAVGVDLWSAVDQSGNRPDTTLRNAGLEGVAERVELHTGDMRELPFPDGSFDLVVSSLAIHNIADAAGRSRAVEQAARVLKPGARLLIADFRATREYAARLRELGMQGVSERRLGWRFWYGNPWAATRLVTATRPA